MFIIKLSGVDHFILNAHASHLSWQKDFIIIVATFIFGPWKFALEKKRGSAESLEAEMVEYLKEQVPLKSVYVVFCFIHSNFLPNIYIFTLCR